MSLPGAASGDFSDALDPFGLWEQPARGGLAFDAAGPAEDAGGPGSVWTVDAGQPETLAERERLVEAQAAGLEEAEARLDAFLRAQAGGARKSGVNYSAPFSTAPLSTAPMFTAPMFTAPMPEAERELAQSLALLGGDSGIAPSYGLPGGVDIEELRARFEAWMERANRQLLHLAWVDTLAEGRLAARTAVAWNGSVSTTCTGALDPSLLATHRQSFGLAMTSRVTVLRSVAAVASMAAKISLAVATPLGPLQALLLAAQFLRTVVVPAAKVLMEE